MRCVAGQHARCQPREAECPKRLSATPDRGSRLAFGALVRRACELLHDRVELSVVGHQCLRKVVEKEAAALELLRDVFAELPVATVGGLARVALDVLGEEPLPVAHGEHVRREADDIAAASDGLGRDEDRCGATAPMRRTGSLTGSFRRPLAPLRASIALVRLGGRLDLVAAGSPAAPPHEGRRSLGLGTMSLRQALRGPT
jgi:hypothetical protein